MKRVDITSKIVFCVICLALPLFVTLVSAVAVTECTNLTSADTVYTLSNNISAPSRTCINVVANNVTLDCQGYSINYSYGSTIGGYGVNVTGFNFTTIKNCIIKESYFVPLNKHAIYFYDADNATIYNNTIRTISTGTSGIYMMINSTSNNISSNTIISSAGTASGIFLNLSGLNTISANLIVANRLRLVHLLFICSRAQEIF